MPETVVMIHGMMCGPWCWENYMNYLESRGYHCLAPALRYHDVDPGDSSDPGLGSTGLKEYVADIEEVIKDLEAPPVLIGHSMGGLIAQLLAARGRASKLVLLAPAAPAGIFGLRWSVVKSFADLVKQWNFWNKPFRASFDRAVYSVLHLLPGEEQQAVYNRMVYESGRAAFQIGFWLLDREQASRVNEKEVNCPVLVMAGKEDRITPAPVIRKVAAKYGPDAVYKEWDCHAHWLPGEPGWQEIAEYVHLWLAGEAGY